MYDVETLNKMNSTNAILQREGFFSLLMWKPAITVLIVFTAAVIWKHINHPLYRFPGPWLARWSNLPYSYWFLGRRQPYKFLALHEKYGPVVRIAPNELSFNTANSWKDIYAFRKGHGIFTKSEFYNGSIFSGLANSIIGERDPDTHAQIRKSLSTAFSDRSLKEQEHLINEVVDDLMEQLGVRASGEQGSDIVVWFQMTAVDIIGNLAFGEVFGGVKSGKVHFWVALMIDALSKAAIVDTFNRFPLLAKLIKFFLPKVVEALIRDAKIMQDHTISLVERRVKNPNNRPDFLTRILESRETENITNIQLAAYSSDFIIAGSETTATSLSCITYYLLQYPIVMHKLQTEIRTAFKTYDDITVSAAANLKYLHAVVLEGMRIYAPVPFGLPRVVPPGGDSVDGHFLPAGAIVSTNPVAASLSSANFDSPWEFRPERWLGSNKRDILEAAQPFSLGSRGCLGRSLAWVELIIILAKLHFTYDLESVNGQLLDWHRDTRMDVFWRNPKLHVRVSSRT